MPALYYLNAFLKKQDLTALNQSEALELETILLNAISEELENPDAHSCWVQLGISTYSPSPQVLTILNKNGLHFTCGKNYSYLEWNNGLLTGQAN